MGNIRGYYQFKVLFKKWFLAGVNNTDSIIEGCKTLVDNICSKRSLQHSTLLYYRDAVDVFCRECGENTELIVHYPHCTCAPKFD